ncbi:uncharacterized protein MCYG_06663 [Microsporum canis CBS 113480]|uniref:Uncharacterized protein n=1 Tax=Arthroderma otae (strain ATCC MYA-4605 / CBS 113480) TaxID=554155 RepID=C5FVB0_ARTOC|nr:uncharacterized protein MCYG_06663 [Microsporum canis CBS 113480]EEQ33844.1 predicted protein [Microsporum canis CBS 113480]
MGIDKPNFPPRNNRTVWQVERARGTEMPCSTGKEKKKVSTAFFLSSPPAQRRAKSTGAGRTEVGGLRALPGIIIIYIDHSRMSSSRVQKGGTKGRVREDVRPSGLVEDLFLRSAGWGMFQRQDSLEGYQAGTKEEEEE